MDDLLHLLDEILKDLTSKDLSLMQRTDRVYAEHGEVRNTRLERLFALADLCRV
jgi:hypothetical protein